MNSNEFLIPKTVSDESIRQQVKLYWPNDYRRNRTYLKRMNKSHEKIQQVLPALEAIVSSQNQHAVDKRAVRTASGTTVTRYRPGSVSYEDLLKKADVAVKEQIVRRPKRKLISVKLTANFYVRFLYVCINYVNFNCFFTIVLLFFLFLGPSKC